MTKNHLLFTCSMFFPMAFAIASAGGCASSAHDNGDSTSAEDPLTGGALVRSDTTPAIYIYNGCSAVKVSPRHLLTAGHCVLMHGFSTGRLELDTNYTPGTVISMSSMRITPSPTIGPWFVTTILQTDIHPAFRAACIGQLDCDETVDPYPSDLAVITLRESFPSEFGPSATLSGAAVGTFAFVTGYGCENGMDGGPPSPPRLKTQAMQLIRPDISGVVNQTQFGANYHVTAGQNAGGAASLCAGDSGGGVFAGPFNAGGNLVAINTSGIFGDPNGRSTRHTHARVDAPGVKQWILGITQPVGGTNGVDPNNPDFNYCNAAAQMCAIHQQREYFKLVTHCEQLGGQAPPCEFPDAATICMKADLACAQKNLSGWAALATQCQKLGGKTVQCGDSTWTL